VRHVSASRHSERAKFFKIRQVETEDSFFIFFVVEEESLDIFYLLVFFVPKENAWIYLDRIVAAARMDGRDVAPTGAELSSSGEFGALKAPLFEKGLVLFKPRFQHLIVKLLHVLVPLSGLLHIVVVTGIDASQNESIMHKTQMVIPLV
jgi:hypothetical protein